ncbi:12647_t:CDS:2, partial [Cetraspora pellucida]
MYFYFLTTAIAMISTDYYKLQKTLSSLSYSMLQEIEKEEHAENLKMNILQAIHFIAKSWKEVSVDTIQNYPVLNDIVNTIETLDLSNPMQVEEFLEILDENIIYKVPLDDEVIK